MNALSPFVVFNDTGKSRKLSSPYIAGIHVEELSPMSEFFAN